MKYFALHMFVNTYPKRSLVICMDYLYIVRTLRPIITSPPIGGGRGIVMPMSVCLFVCLFVCVFVRVFAKCQSVISQSFLNRSS